MIKKLTAAALLLGMTSVAHAVASGVYLGAQAGASAVYAPTTNVQTGPADPITGVTPTTPASPSKTGFGGRLFFGYNFNQYVALEGGYTYYGPATYNVTSTANCGGSTSKPQIRESAVDFVGKGIWPVGYSFGVFGKAGIAYGFSTASNSIGENEINTCSGTTTTSFNPQGSNTAVRPTAGIGVSYDINQNWVTDFSITRMFGNSNVSTADLIALGISYHFVDKYCGQFLC